MKKIFTTLLIIFSFSFCKAQWVTIPDANFRNWLNANGYASCMNGTLMDTTCSAVVNAIAINFGWQGISNLTGIQYFDHLQSLNCSDNPIASLPQLPGTLTTLDISGNQIFSLPALPSGLQVLNCNGNTWLSALPSLPVGLTLLNCGNCNLTSLPSLPSGLTTLFCFTNQLTSLPNLPGNLLELGCGSNQLTSLPSLSANLVTLNCEENQLTSLPTLSATLQNLYCYSNQLTTLPILSNNIEILDCRYNQLTSLPSLPPNLGGLYCGYNQLNSLPSLPNSLFVLICHYNQITTLPFLPSGLISLDCSYNQLTFIPNLPQSIYFFDVRTNPALSCMPILQIFNGGVSSFNISNTGITCLPNTIQHTGSIPAIDTMPICTCTYPSGITTTNITSTSAKVNWSMECCSQFQIQKRITGTTTWSTVTALATATSKNLTALTPGTTYDLRMRVKCTDAITYSSWSPIQTFTTLVNCVAPNGVTVSNLTQTHATINWNTVTNAYAFKFSGRKLGTTAWTTYTIYSPLTVKQLNGLTANTTYQYRMQTVCSASGIPTSPWTAISTFNTPLRMEDEIMENEKIDFTIYPNPVSQLLTVMADFSIGDEIEIKDLLGRTLITQTQGSDYSNPAGTQSSNTIDVSNLSAAQYFVSIRKNDGSVLIKQFVKE